MIHYVSWIKWFDCQFLTDRRVSTSDYYENFKILSFTLDFTMYLFSNYFLLCKYTENNNWSFVYEGCAAWRLCWRQKRIFFTLIFFNILYDFKIGIRCISIK